MDFWFLYRLFGLLLGIGSVQAQANEWEQLIGEAISHKQQRQYEKAIAFAQQALEAAEKNLGLEHPKVALSLRNAAANFWAQGGTTTMSRALDLFERANTVREHHLKLMMANGSEQDKRDYMTTIEADPYTMTSFHRALPDNTQAARLALTTVLQHKSCLLDAVTQSVMTLRQQIKRCSINYPISMMNAPVYLTGCSTAK